MGRHVMGLAPAVKPRYRFVVAILAILGLAGVTIGVTAVLKPGAGSAGAPAGTTSVDTATSSSTADTSSGPLSADPGPTGPVNAVYAIPPGGVTADGFQAQITLNNPTCAPVAWRVRLVFDSGVSQLTQSWLDGAPFTTAAQAGPEFTLDSTTDIGPQLTVVLKLQFVTTSAATPASATAPASSSASPSADITVRLCTVNGRPCNRA